MVAYFQDTQALGHPGPASFEVKNLGSGWTEQGGAVGCGGELGCSCSYEQWLYASSQLCWGRQDSRPGSF